MFKLLQQLVRNNISENYIGRILVAFREDEQKTLPNEFTHSSANQTSLGILPMDEPLTKREMEILHMLAQRLRDKEIAEQLCISPKTVKSHLQHIYAKLNTGNRIQDVSIAREKGLLP